MPPTPPPPADSPGPYPLFQKRTTCPSLRPQPWIPPTWRKRSRTSSQVVTGPAGVPEGGPRQGPSHPGHMLQSTAPKPSFVKTTVQSGHGDIQGLLHSMRPGPTRVSLRTQGPSCKWALGSFTREQPAGAVGEACGLRDLEPPGFSKFLLWKRRPLILQNRVALAGRYICRQVWVLLFPGTQLALGIGGTSGSPLGGAQGTVEAFGRDFNSASGRAAWRKGHPEEYCGLTRCFPPPTP